jgi:hypothetical protein
MPSSEDLRSTLTGAKASGKGKIPKTAGVTEGVMEGMTKKDTQRSKRYTVPEAAKVLGIGTDAVRKRIARSTILHEKDADGRVYVYLDTGQDEGHDAQEPAPELVESLREQIGYLQGVIATRDEELRTRAEELRRRDQDLERRDRIIAALTERIPPALEAPSEARESPRTLEEEPERVEPRPATAEAQEGERPWWRRVFGGWSS